MAQTLKDSQVIPTAIETYGCGRQLRKTQEECGELIAAINRIFEQDDKKVEREFINEAADVQIMLMQISAMVGSKRFKRAVQTKLTNLKKRLEETNGNN